MLVYGPDCLSELDKERLAIPTDDYVRTLFGLARPEKVMFSTDFAWNVNDRGAWKDLRWDSIERIRKLLNTEDQEKSSLKEHSRFLQTLNRLLWDSDDLQSDERKKNEGAHDDQTEFNGMIHAVTDKRIQDGDEQFLKHVHKRKNGCSLG